MEPRTVPEPRRPKTLFDKLAYGFGSVAYGVKDNGFSYLLLLYYNQVIGMPASQVGLALLIVLVIDALVDPALGYASDNTRSRWGRRHPYMYAAAIPVAISYLALWNPPDNLSDAAQFWYLVVVASVVRVFISFNEIPSTSLVADLTEDYDQRTSFLSYRYFFGWWGGLTVHILAFSYFLRPTPEQPVGQLNQAGYQSYAVVASLLMLTAILVSALATHRHIPSFALPPPKRPMSLGRVARDMLETLNNRAFLVMAAAALFGYCSQGLVAAMITYFRTYFWELSGPQIGLISAGNFASALVALLLAPRVSKALGKKRGVITVSLLVILFSPLVYLARFAGIMPPNGSDALVAVLFCSSFISVVLSIISGILTTSMFADVVEDSQLRTGRRNDGVFFSANSFVAQCVAGVGLFLAGVILQFAAFPEGARPGEVPDEVLNKLMFTEISVVAGLQVLNLAFLFLYPITRAKHQANLDRLAAATLERSHVPYPETSASNV